MKTATITQDILLPGAPHDIFELWMDSEKHASFTNGEAKIDRQVGGAFTTFDGWATGKTLELVPDKKIVQLWRAEEWPAGHFSTITVLLAPAPTGTAVTFTQTDIPSTFAKGVTKGWQDFYWTPIQKLLTSDKS